MRRALLALSLAIPIGLSACNESDAVPLCPAVSPLNAFRIRVSRTDKVDVLLVVDNSPSMADKQALLARDLPELISTLTTATRDPFTGLPRRVSDVHLAVISSSLGSHGTSACATAPHGDDHGHLLPRASDCAAAIAASPLSWTYESGKGAMSSGLPATQLQSAAACVVTSVKDDGCGFEETWESAYHFLVDPAPYAKADVTCPAGTTGAPECTSKIVVGGLDNDLLAQRAAFLRPDSALLVLVLSDENDASLKPAGLNWLPWGYAQGKMLHGWGACAGVPDDFEPDTAADFTKLHAEYKCFSCFENASDPACKLDWLESDPDAPNLRAFQQVQRFGYNFLWGRRRYVDAFTTPTVLGSDNKYGANPIFAGGFRDPSMVTVAAIVGVPKQLVTQDDGTPRSMTDADWELAIGPVGKRDPHMIESIAPRTGIPLFAGDRSVDGVNGGDRTISAADDLQYACIASRVDKGKGPDCTASTSGDPLCGTDGSQPYFKAYPGLRHLRIVKELGASGMVASICNDTLAPTLRAIGEKVKAGFDSCLRTDLHRRSDGTVSCSVFEVMQPTAGVAHCEEVHGLCTPGAAPCRKTPIARAKAAAQLNLAITVVQPDGTSKSVSTQSTVEGDDVVLLGSDGRRHLVCEVEQLSGATLDACARDASFSLDPTKAGGFCYSTSDSVIGETCKGLGAPGTVRFLGGAAPRNGSELFPLCGSTEGGC